MICKELPVGVKNMRGDIISVEGVIFQRKGRKILDGIDWNVFRGEHWVIVGLNGSGKTSLLKILTGYQWATKGSVHVLGNRFGKTNLPELRKTIGWVSSSLDEQLVSRAHDSALEVVLSGKYASIGLYEKVTNEEIEQAEDLLSQLNMDGFADTLFVNLSQGEKRRVAIARALMTKPELLILDEPCNGLDVYAKEKLLSTIQSMAVKKDGPTLLYVTHQLEEVVPAISHSLLLREGRKVAAGEKKQVLTAELLEETFSIPVSINWKDERPWLQIEARL